MSNDDDDLGNLGKVDTALSAFVATNQDLLNALHVEDAAAARRIVAGPADKTADAVMKAIETTSPTRRRIARRPRTPTPRPSATPSA